MSPICDTDWTRATLRKNKVIPRSPTPSDTPDILYPERLTPPIRPARKKKKCRMALKITEVDCTSMRGDQDFSSEEESDEDENPDYGQMKVESYSRELPHILIVGSHMF